MKHLFIINPAAGKKDRTVELTKKIAAVFGVRELDYDVKVSAAKGDCARLAKAAAETGEEYRIYACGGDGTLNEVVRGAAGYPNVAVTHVPCGSGNDFVRAFSEPEAFLDLARLLEGEERTMDLIALDGTPCSLNICSMGIDARIGAEVVRYKRLPGISGHTAYNISTVMNLLKGISRSCIVEVAGNRIQGPNTLVCICNGRYYGGYNPVPEADPTDGLLDVLVIRGVSLLTAARVIGKYKRGEYAALPEYISHYRVKELTVRCPEETVISADGECLWAQEAKFEVLPAALRFFIPKGVTYGAKTPQEAACVAQ